jgi:hypothetical protein
MGCSGGSGGPGSVDSGESEDLVDAGIDTLDEETSDALLEAIELFEDALVADPGNDVARSLLAMAEVLAFFDEPNTARFMGSGCGMDLDTLLDRLDIELGEGTTIFSLLDGTAPEPMFPEGPPSDPPTGIELQSFLRCELIPLLQETAEKLEAVSSGFTHEFEDGLLGSDPFTIDYGDAHLLAGALRGAEMALHLTCIFELAIDPEELVDGESELLLGRSDGALGSPGWPTQLFTGDSPTDVVAEQLCEGNTGVFNEHALLGTAGLLDASAEAQTHLDEWRAAAAQLLMNINDAVDGKVALADAGADPGLIEIDSTFICAQAVWLPWLVDMVDALQGTDSSVAAVEVPEVCGIEIYLPALEIPEELFEAATYSNRPFLPTYGEGECYDVDESSFSHIDDAIYDNLHALAAEFAEDGTVGADDMYYVWIQMECAFESMLSYSAGCDLAE